jgi:hypothetical protein
MSCNCDENPLVLPVGAQGEQGPVGPAGPAGPIGPQGTQGPAGIVGGTLEYSYNYGNIVGTGEGSASNINVAYFRFPGTVSFGTPSSVKAVVSGTMIFPDAVNIIVRDVTNNVIVAAVYGIVPLVTPSVVNVPIISGTFSTSEVVFRLEYSISGGNPYIESTAFIYSLDITI